MQVKPGCVVILTLLAAVCRGEAPSHDLTKEKVLYCVGYAHLDTQWRWDYAKTIGQFIKDTLEQNFDRFEKYPGYVFNFTGSVRYEFMKEYYPEQYKKLKEYVAKNRWFVAGSNVDEGDANIPAPESIIRHVLYSNQFYRQEFGKECVDFMLPDSFGFQACLPSVLAHCGLLGFSTQKLSWGSAVGIPFKIGRWVGPDGKYIIAALDPGPYAGAIEGPVHTNEGWVKRIEENGKKYGVFADFHYYGVGDVGGAPKEEDVKNYVTCAAEKECPIRPFLTSSGQFFKDLSRPESPPARVQRRSPPDSALRRNADLRSLH
jgi:alpha-mannosidase